MRALWHLIRRDLTLVLRSGTDAGAALAFFVVTVTLFPFGIGPEPEILGRVAAGLIWVSALLATLLSMERLFQADYEDGTLDQLLLAGVSAEAIAVAKIAAHWLVTGLPLLIVAPVMGALIQLPTGAYGVMIASLAMGTPVLSLIGGIGAALILGARRGGALLALLVLPLFVPPLIFAVGAIDAAALGLSPRPNLLFLAGLLAAALPLAPVAAAAAIRQVLD
ncbi:MAG: heme exporter protein CcmB [Pseudomonadota bacterium]